MVLTVGDSNPRSLGLEWPQRVPEGCPEHGGRGLWEFESLVVPPGWEGFEPPRLAGLGVGSKPPNAKRPLPLGVGCGRSRWWRAG